MDKETLRKQFRKIVASLNNREQSSQQIVDKLLGNKNFLSSNYTLSYAATSTEPDLNRAHEYLLDNRKKIYLPVLAAGKIGEYTKEAKLVPNKLGIPEPEKIIPDLFYSRLEIVIMPGLAFDKHGYRLGHGGGWYDRFLTKVNPDCFKIGVCFKEQFIESLPHDSWDMPVDLIITN